MDWVHQMAPQTERGKEMEGEGFCRALSECDSDLKEDDDRATIFHLIFRFFSLFDKINNLIKKGYRMSQNSTLNSYPSAMNTFCCRVIHALICRCLTSLTRLQLLKRRALCLIHLFPANWRVQHRPQQNYKGKF